jgi:DMSO/TMAO reductase YedYZ molybdopterin-dependent catalytic subunit
MRMTMHERRSVRLTRDLPLCWFWGFALLAALVAAAVVACGDEPVKTGSSPSVQASGSVVLKVTGPKGTKSLTMSELEALPAFEGYAGMKSSTGMITPPAVHKGVPLADLADLVGGLQEDEGVTVLAADGYGMTLSHRQASGEGLTTYDPADGAETPPDQPLTVMVAYQREGKPLGEDEGPLRLVAGQPEMGQVIDGHWTVKWVTEIEVKKETAPWRVDLVGAVSAQLDRGKYVNCASPGCHGSGFIDSEDRRWAGIPLYLVCGLVDDTERHGKGAYDAKAARAGYTIDIETADGKVVHVDSRDIAGKRSVVLAGKMNGMDLPEEDFPLRLVGPGLSDDVQVGRIARIVVRVK